MNNNRSIVIAALLIGFAILFIFRWEIAVNNLQAYRLDRWSGKITACNTVDAKKLGGVQLGVGIEYRCTEITEKEFDKMLNVPKNK